MQQGRSMSPVAVHKSRKAFDEVEVIHGVDIDIPRRRVRHLGRALRLWEINASSYNNWARTYLAGQHRDRRTHRQLRATEERGIVIVFQNYALCSHMTVAENMGFQRLGTTTVYVTHD
jgi:ABC-type polar amino acid transport system ATPase subunit